MLCVANRILCHLCMSKNFTSVSFSHDFSCNCKYTHTQTHTYAHSFPFAKNHTNHEKWDNCVSNVLRTMYFECASLNRWWKSSGIFVFKFYLHDKWLRRTYQQQKSHFAQRLKRFTKYTWKVLEHLPILVHLSLRIEAMKQFYTHFILISLNCSSN